MHLNLVLDSLEAFKINSYFLSEPNPAECVCNGISSSSSNLSARTQKIHEQITVVSNIVILCMNFGILKCQLERRLRSDRLRSSSQAAT